MTFIRYFVYFIIIFILKNLYNIDNDLILFISNIFILGCCIFSTRYYIGGSISNENKGLRTNSN